MENWKSRIVNGDGDDGDDRDDNGGDDGDSGDDGGSYGDDECLFFTVGHFPPHPPVWGEGRRRRPENFYPFFRQFPKITK